MGAGIIILGIIIILIIIFVGIMFLQNNQANATAYNQCTGSFLHEIGLQQCSNP